MTWWIDLPLSSGNSDKVCPMMDSDNLVVYIQERMDGESLSRRLARLDPISVKGWWPRPPRQPCMEADRQAAAMHGG